jgi:hypothetical protein
MVGFAPEGTVISNNPITQYLTKCPCGGELDVTYKRTIVPSKYARIAKCKKCSCRQFSHVELASSDNNDGDKGKLTCEMCLCGTKKLVISSKFDKMVCEDCYSMQRT